MARVVVCIPTVGGRDAMLRQTVDAWADQLHSGIKTFWVDGYTWGEGCNRIASLCCGGGYYTDPDYLVFAADDCVPRPGALKAAVDHWLTTGTIPGARFYQDGQPLAAGFDDLPAGTATTWTRLFLLTPEVYRQVGPLLDISWFADFDYSDRLAEAGYPITVCDGFAFDHLDGERTWAVDGEVDRQRRVYREACAVACRSPRS